MKIMRFATLAVILACAPGARAATPAAASAPTTAPIERFKALAGEWVSAVDGPFFKKGDLVARYAVTAGGSTVVETVFPGSQHEMVTVYHADGKDLVLTHFCMAGNQPRMQAQEMVGDTIAFEFLDATGLDTPDEGHMHRATFHFDGPDRFVTQWTFRAGDKDVFSESETCTRDR